MVVTSIGKFILSMEILHGPHRILPERANFGTILLTDDPMAETPDPGWAMVRRAQGMYTTSSLDGSNAHITLWICSQSSLQWEHPGDPWHRQAVRGAMFSIVFTNRASNGSTLHIQGTGKQFRFVRGYMKFETTYMDMPQAYLVIQCNVTVRLD
ncbi:hypothetical protein ACJRO7_001663 [Eucalyptus globulus]|uniref:Dirigent protein n=1 Tax=Eucalyptus globulus TaxID=34317 RepID=A0ABD3LRU2_EUCGL